MSLFNKFASVGRLVVGEEDDRNVDYWRKQILVIEERRKTLGGKVNYSKFNSKEKLLVFQIKREK